MVWMWSPAVGASVGSYTLKEVVARGSAASIWRATLADQAVGIEAVAIKCISQSRVGRELIDTETETLRLTCSHPNVISLLQVVHIEQWTCLVMPLASGIARGPDLEQALSSCGGKFAEDTAREYFRQIMLAVAHCHSCSVSHGDLKMENVLLQRRHGREPDPLLLLCDFGCATTSASRTDLVGTANYVAPEAVAQESANYDSRKADMFSVGVLLYTMLVGNFPFARPPLSALNSRATRAAVRAAYDNCDAAALQFPPQVSAEAADLVRSLLQRDPSARPCAATVVTDTWLLQEGVPPVVPAAVEPEPEPVSEREPEPELKPEMERCALPSLCLRRQTEPDAFADAPEESAALLCSRTASPRVQLVGGGAARCACCGLLRPRTLSLPVRLTGPQRPGCEEQIVIPVAADGCGSRPCDPCC